MKGKTFETKRKLKIILLVWPIVLLLGVLLHISYQQHQIDNILMDADGLVWQSAGTQFAVQIMTREEGELLHIGIDVINPEKKRVYKKAEVIDKDMFGGGFVRAVQLDQDTEIEIIVWHARAKYYLDFSAGNVIEISFDQAPQEVKDLAENWHKYNVMAGLEITMLLIFMLGYYILTILILTFIKPTRA